MIGIDTHVLVRHLTRDDEQQSEIAHKYLMNECTAEQPAFINRIVQCEVVWVLERACQYTREKIAHALEVIFRTRQFQVEDQESALAALPLYRQHKADHADALIGVSDKAVGCDVALTFDRKAEKFSTFRDLKRS